MDKPLRVAGDSSSQGWAVVTGASSGIGREFARELARRGHKVLAVARRRERLEALATEAAKEGGSVAALAADLGTAEGLKLVITRLTSLGKIDLLVNNAGIATSGDFQSSSLEQGLVAVRLNVHAVMTLTHAVMGEMLRRDRGAIINIASVVAFQPFPHFAVYAASKAFVLSFTEALAEEVKGSGVRILAVCPGAAKTEMSVFSHNEGLLGKLPSLGADQIVRTALRAIERGRVVKVVGWLKSNAGVPEPGHAPRRGALDDGRHREAAVRSDCRVGHVARGSKNDEMPRQHKGDELSERESKGAPGHATGNMRVPS